MNSAASTSIKKTNPEWSICCKVDILQEGAVASSFFHLSVQNPHAFSFVIPLADGLFTHFAQVRVLTQLTFIAPTRATCVIMTKTYSRY